MIMRLCIAICAALALSTAARADDTGVLSRIIHNAGRGETVVIKAGRYDIADLKIRKSVTIVGEGDVTFFSSRSVAKGLLNPMPHVSVRVENITFEGARSPDLNGAGIRHDGDDLWVVNCRFIDNDDGILATGSDFGEIHIESSEFVGNGHGDGYSHGIYVARAERLEVTASKFVGTRIGHHVKSLAATTNVRDNLFDDADGRSSYAVDASKGGAVTITGNSFTKSADADNETIVNYDLTRGGKAVSLVIRDNVVVNHHRGGRLLRNATSLQPIVENNGPPGEERAAPNLKPAAAPPKPLKLEQLQPDRGSSPALLKAPEIHTQAGELAAFVVQNNTKEESPADYLTFGQAFAEGALKPGTPVMALYGANALPAQIDVKALNSDGSVRHAAVTVATPELKAGREVRGALVALPAKPLADFDAAALISVGYAFPLRLKFVVGAGAANQLTLEARDLVLAALAKAGGDRWLDGPLVKEVRVEKLAAPHLLLRFDVRIYRDGDVRTSLAFSNEKSFSLGRRDLVYDVTIGGDEAPAFYVKDLAQHRSSVWRRSFWSGAAPRLHLVRDVDLLIRARALLPLDRSQGASGRAIADLAAKLDNAAPLSSALVLKYFPTTGGRGDIGPYPQWTALHLVAQNGTTEALMLANAEAAGAVPWHFIDEKTGAPINIESRRKFWADERGLQEQYAPDRPHRDIFASGDGGWTPDHAHKPSLTYVPYLLTADRFYADELAMQAAWAIFGRWPDLREGGLKAIDVEQARASAWSLRDLSDAAFILPEGHKLKRYFEKAVALNLEMMRAKYIDRRAMKSAGEVEGYIEEPVNREADKISPWQQDYMAIELALAAKRGDENARALLGWMTNFQAGRFLSADFDPRRATSYLLAIKDAATGSAFANWAEVARHTYGGPEAPAIAEMEGYPTMAAGYIGSAYAALSAIASETQSLPALEALGVLARQSAGLPLWSTAESGGVTANPQFLLMLKARDGSFVSRSEIAARSKSTRFVVGGDGAETLSAGAVGALIFGFGGDDRIDGGAGADDLFGGAGRDIITGGGGDDRLVGGPGDDRLEGGSGADIFAFYGGDAGSDEISDFSVDEDAIGLAASRFDASMDHEGLIQMTPTGARIDLGDGNSVILRGVEAATLGARNFLLIR